MLHKFGSNLDFKTDGNSIIKLNSARRLSYIAGDLRLASRRARGRLWRRAGVVKAVAWLLLASEPRYKGRDAVVVVFLPPLFSPAAIAIIPLSFTIAVAPSCLRQSLPQLRLVLAHPANQLWSLVFAGNSLCVVFFLAVGSVSVERALSWPARCGEPLSLLGVVKASLGCHGA